MSDNSSAQNTKTYYSNGQITVVFDSSICVGNGVCSEMLPQVYNEPSIDVSKATTEQLINQIKQCPSGALSYLVCVPPDNLPNSTLDPYPQKTLEVSDKPVTEFEVKVMKGGPAIILEKVKIIYQNGNTEERNTKTSLCRCGLSQKQPFCDGAHKTSNFSTTDNTPT